MRKKGNDDMNANRKPNRKILSCLAAVLFVFLGAGCQKNAAPTYEGHPSSPYITALAKGEYYLEMSMFYNGTIIENTLAVKGEKLESRSSLQTVSADGAGAASVSHTLRLGDTTYFLDDDEKVYFASRAVGDNGLSGSIDYATAVYTASGEDTLATGATLPYDEYSVSAKDESTYTLRLFTNDDALYAIVLINGEESIEQDVSTFSAKIPSGMLSIPKGYTEVSEDEYFRDYYGKEK